MLNNLFYSLIIAVITVHFAPMSVVLANGEGFMLSYRSECRGLTVSGPLA